MTQRFRVAILSAALWHDRFASDPRVTGKSITLDGIPYTVVGVMPSGFNFPAATQLWTPLSVTLDQRINLCRADHQQATPLPYESRDLLALSAFVAHKSRGVAPVICLNTRWK